MNLDMPIKTLILSVVNIFETGTPDGKYDDISIYADGKPDASGKKTRQVTYGRSQTTEQGNLKDLIAAYIANNGVFSKNFSYYLPKIGVEPLVDNEMFKTVLKDAAREDPIMKTTQDAFFDKRYFQPAVTFCVDNKFTLPLSMLVIYDSHIHSGKVPQTVRNMFSESIPKNGGDEKEWIKAYVDARRRWLLRLQEPVPQTVYRMDCFKAQINIDNWMLDKPVLSNGTLSKDTIDLTSNSAAQWEGFEMKDTPVSSTPLIYKLMKRRLSKLE